MSVMGFFEPASPTTGRGLGIPSNSSGLGAGIRVEGPVLEGRMSVGEALVAVGGVRCSLPSTLTPWNQAENDAIWAERDSVFG